MKETLDKLDVMKITNFPVKSRVRRVTRYAIEGRICLHSTPEGGLLVNARRTQINKKRKTS